MKLGSLLPASILSDRWRQMAIPGWAVSLLFHAVAILVLSRLILPPPSATAEVSLESLLAELPEEPDLDRIDLEPLPLEPPQNLAAPDSQPAVEPPPMSQINPLSEIVEPSPLSPVDMQPLDQVADLLAGPNPMASAALGKGSTFSARGRGLRRAMVAIGGGTKQTEQAVAAGLAWLQRHQYPDGHWSLHQFPCRKQHCSGEAEIKSDMAATAFGLLPFLAAGQTHQSKGPYRATVTRGLAWMLAHQDQKTGSLAKGFAQTMYTHGLATITLAEAYGLTGDKRLGKAAQAAVRFIEYAQSPAHGGWRYTPGSPTGDTSVVGWQVMALKSAQIAGLQVNPRTLDLVEKFLRSVSAGRYGGKFGYTDNKNISATRTAIGLLCKQYLGAHRDDPALEEGIRYILQYPPSLNKRNCYYWYYATQVMHNMQGTQWDRWNREMRSIWLQTQEKQKGSCQFGSWDPSLPTSDQWGEKGGRLMVTSLGLLTLEIYYRYLPLYKIMAAEANVAAAK